MTLRKLLTASLLFLSVSTFAQLRELRFKRLGVEHGMPENYATCHIQDKYGYHWFGTQNGLVRYDGYKVKVYNLETESGWTPSYRSIWSLVEDKDGNIWVSTSQEGIFKFDRTTEKCINYRLPKGVEDRGQTFRLLIDREGMIWGGFRTVTLKWHLDRFDPKTGRFTVYDSTGNNGGVIPSGVFTWNLITKDGNFWVSGNHGLHRYDYSTKKFITVLNKDIRYFYEAPSEPGILWLSQKEGNKFLLTRYDVKTGDTEVFRHDAANAKSIHSDSVFSIYETAAKDLWVSTGNGISLFNRANKTFKSYLPPNPFPEDSLSNTCYSFWEGKRGDLWINTLRTGILYLPSPGSTMQRYVYDDSRPEGLPNNVISSNSFIDRDGNFWVLTRSEGINKLDEKASQFEYVQQYNEQSGYRGGSLIAIAMLDRDHALVLGAKGLYRYNKKDRQYIPIDIPIAREKKITLNDVIVDRSGIAWLCSGQGLFRYDPRSGRSKQYLNDPADSTSLSHNTIRDVFEDSKGNLWIGTYGGGLNKMDRATGKFNRYPFSIDQRGLEKGVLDDDQIIHIYEDRKGVLWIGTNNGGLNRMDAATGRFTSYFSRDNGFQCVRQMYEDSKGRFWVGTYLWGLFLFDRESGKVVRRFTEKEGLAFDQADGIKEDEQGRIWVASNRGFTILDGNNFAISYLNTSNGLPNNSNTAINIYEWDDDWLIGSKGGFIRFKPSELIKSTTAPKVLIESVAFNDGNADSTILLADQSKLTFGYDENRLQFQFVGLHYSNSALTRYQYKLDGYDKDWIQAGTQRLALYTNLSPGNYRFFVKAANSDGVWSDPVSIEVIVLPPWWKTWWAYALYVLVFGFAVWKYIGYRSKKLKRENKVLEEKVQHRTAQLQNTIESLKSTQQQLVQSEKMASLGELTAGIAHEIQNPLNFVNNFSEMNQELLNEMNEELAKENYAEVKQLAIDITSNEEKIAYHGKRADAIVKNMLQHSRSGSGKKEPTDINALADEYLRLSYHGLRAKDKSFNANFKTSFDENVGKVNVIGQDVGRVLLNLYNNAFYAVSEKKKQFDDSYQPMIEVHTKRDGDKVVVHVKDNGTGIPDRVVKKIYQPFFTTKPTGEGTGLGLSLSYDIITKGHGGDLQVETKEGEGTEFIITLKNEV